jgi:hypothetical protein
MEGNITHIFATRLRQCKRALSLKMLLMTSNMRFHHENNGLIQHSAFFIKKTRSAARITLPKMFWKPKKEIQNKSSTFELMKDGDIH